MKVISRVARYFGRPYFLVEGPAGVFGVMKLFYINPNENDSINLVVDKTPLEIKKDLVEIATGGQAISVEHPLESDCYEVTRMVIWELRQYSFNCNKQFVSYVPFQGNFGAYVGKRNDMAVMRVEPRLFQLTK